MEHQCCHCEKPADSVHTFTVYDENGAEERLEVLCGEWNGWNRKRAELGSGESCGPNPGRDRPAFFRQCTGSFSTMNSSISRLRYMRDRFSPS